jgi:hypothetical protein
VTFTIPPGVRHRAVVALFKGTTLIGDEGVRSTASLGTLLTFSLGDDVAATASALRVTPPTAAGNAAFEATFTNEGTEPVEPRGVAVVLGAGGTILARVPFDARRVLPGELVVLRTEFAGDLEPGAYIALATFEFNGRSLTRTAKLEIP